MNRIKIIVDSASDIPPRLLEQYDITMMPINVNVDGTDFQEGVDFTPHEFYDMLINSKSLPITSQIIPLRFVEEFEKVYNEGYNEIICVTINGTGSATYSNAVLARDDFYKHNPKAKGEFEIHVLDSKAYTSAYGYAVVEAAAKALRGAPSSEITAYLRDWFDSVEIYFAPYTLEFVKRSGRVPVAAAFVGELIGLRPIITIIDGETKIIEKVRGDKAVVPALLKHAKNAMVPQTPYLLVNSMSEAEHDELAEKAKKELGYDSAASYYIGASISINAGPKVAGIIVKGKNRTHNDK